MNNFFIKSFGVYLTEQEMESKKIIKWRLTSTGWYPEIYYKLSEEKNTYHVIAHAFVNSPIVSTLDLPKKDFELQPDLNFLHPILRLIK